MKRLKEKIASGSWRTSALGIACIILGVWAGHNLWVPYQSFKFNILYVETGPIALIVVGLMGICARDHRHIRKP